ncbi:hypothetical protein GF412_00775 [Candidatus Micrarchaeota archaeon]|nr:hypothetical protein [Candidatus Micrarchaeota archaeon]MBD3417507.1 hypothetical protein [Candidatus Micrarchaeota archaeon]
MSSKKGQAAMEYLMTYGWALVALVAVIAALMATGAFNPSYLIAEECTLQPDLACTGHLLYIDSGGTPQLEFRISNGLGHDILLGDVKVTTSDNEEYESYDLDPAGSKIEQGESKEVMMALGNLRTIKDDVEKMKVSITYVTCAPEVNPDCTSGGPSHTVSGRIVAHTLEE